MEPGSEAARVLGGGGPYRPSARAGALNERSKMILWGAYRMEFRTRVGGYWESSRRKLGSDRLSIWTTPQSPSTVNVPSETVRLSM